MESPRFSDCVDCRRWCRVADYLRRFASVTPVLLKSQDCDVQPRLTFIVDDFELTFLLNFNDVSRNLTIMIPLRLDDDQLL